MPPLLYPPCVLRKAVDYTLVPSSHLERKIDIENSHVIATIFILRL